MIPATLPPLSSPHRSRWQKLGQYMTRLKVRLREATGVDPEERQSESVSQVQNSPSESLATPEKSLGLIPQVVLSHLFQVDTRRERTASFFQRLVWQRVSLDASPALIEGLAPVENLVPRETEPALGARSFFSSAIPWNGRGLTPTVSAASPTVDAISAEGPDSLDLRSLMTAATQQAVHTARKRKTLRRPGALVQATKSNSATSFFQSLTWNHRLPQTNP